MVEKSDLKTSAVCSKSRFLIEENNENFFHVKENLINKTFGLQYFSNGTIFFKQLDPKNLQNCSYLNLNGKSFLFFLFLVLFDFLFFIFLYLRIEGRFFKYFLTRWINFSHKILSVDSQSIFRKSLHQSCLYSCLSITVYEYSLLYINIRVFFCWLKEKETEF